MTDVTNGELAYNAYGDSRGWQTYGGVPMPAWPEQAPELRHAWSEAASAVAGPTPAGRKMIAWRHALVTWLSGLGATVLTYLIPVILAASGNLRFTSEWWRALATQVVAATVAGVIAYVGRYAKKS